MNPTLDETIIDIETLSIGLWMPTTTGRPTMAWKPTYVWPAASFRRAPVPCAIFRTSLRIFRSFMLIAAWAAWSASPNVPTPPSWERRSRGRA